MKFGSSLTYVLAALVVVGCGAAQPTPDPAAENEISQVIAENTAPPVEAESNPFAALPLPYRDADFQVGRRAFNQCATCHSVDENGPNLMGPNLFGVFGRQVGTVEEYSFSNALTDADFVWTPELLGEWMANPREFLPGNNMVFAPVRSATDREALLAFLILESGYVDTGQ